MKRVGTTVCWVGVVLVLALASAGTAAPGVERPGREAGAGPGTMQAILREDARLEKKVTLRLGKTPLSEVAAALGREAGVRVTAAREVADEPAIVVVADQPAREVMHHLARLFNYRWTRSGKAGEYAYELYQDLKSRQEEEALRERDRLRALQALQLEFRDYLEWTRRSPEELCKAAAEFDALERQMVTTPPEQGEALRQRFERLHRARLMANSVDRALIRVAATFTPAQWEAMLNGKRFEFSTRAEPGFQPLPRALADELRAARPSQAGHVFDPRPTPERERQREEYEAQLQREWAQAEAIHVTASIALEKLEIDPRSPQRAGLRLYTKPVLPTPPGGYVSPHVSGVVGRAARLAETPARAGPSAAADPVLGRKRALKIELTGQKQRYWRVDWLSRILPQIAAAYKINLVADAYRHARYSLPALPAGEERPLYEVLDALVLPVARWSKEGDFIHVRQHNWYHARVAEIPERIARFWADRLRQERRMTLDDATSLVLTLNDEQIKSFMPTLDDAGIRLGGSLRFVGDRWIEFLRAYGSLSPGQQQTLRTGGTVAYTAMPRAAQAWLDRALDKSDEPVEERQNGELSLRLQNVERVVSASENGFTTVYRTAPPPGAAPDASFRPRILRTQTDPPELGTPPLGRQGFEQAVFSYNYGRRVQCEFEPPWVVVEPAVGRGGGGSP